MRDRTVASNAARNPDDSSVYFVQSAPTITRRNRPVSIARSTCARKRPQSARFVAAPHSPPKTGGQAPNAALR